VVGQVHMGGLISFGPVPYTQFILIVQGVLYLHQQVAWVALLTILALISHEHTYLVGRLHDRGCPQLFIKSLLATMKLVDPFIGGD